MSFFDVGDFDYQVHGKPVSPEVKAALKEQFIDMLAELKNSAKKVLFKISTKPKLVERPDSTPPLSTMFYEIFTGYRIFAGGDDMDDVLSSFAYRLEVEFQKKLWKDGPAEVGEIEPFVMNFMMEYIKKFDKLEDAYEEFIANAAGPEAPEDALAGQWLFSQDRINTPPEPDTDFEKELKVDLHAHFDDSAKLSKKSAKEILNFVDQNQYAGLLRFPEEKYGTVYRGMSLSLAKFEELFGFVPDEGEVGKEEIDINVVPRAATASWTVNIKETVMFANLQITSDTPIAVVFAASVAENKGKFLLNPDRIYDVDKFDEYEKEMETIGLGPIKSHQMVYSRRPSRMSEKQALTLDV